MAVKDPEDHLRAAYRIAKRPLIRSHIQQSLLPRRTTYRGCQVNLHPGDNFTEFKIWLDGASPEEAELDWLEGRIAGKDCVAYDIGANAGIYSLFLSRILGKRSRVLAFEPNPVMFARLMANVDLNACGNVDLHQVAITSRNEEVTLAIPFRGEFATNLGQGRISREAGAEDTKIQVMGREMSHFTSVAAPDFVKIDVEGHEAEILVPFFQNAPKGQWPSLILMEKIHSDEWTEKLWSVLADAGYRTAFETKKNAALERIES